MDNLTAGNPKAHRIRVYYGETTTILEGMPVCYAFDTDTNWFGGSVSNGEVTATTTTADGSHNESRYIRVEDPDADNIHAFAGVVAKGGWCGRAGGRVLDIYVPNGAVVPVRTDQSCVKGRTILAVHTAETHLTGPYESASCPVAIAWEDDTDLASTAGLVLAKLDPNMFISQSGVALDLIADDQDTGNAFALNQILVDFASTTGNCMALKVVATSSAGAASNGYGLAGYFEADIEAAVSAHTAGVGIWTNITGGIQTQNITVLEVGMYESGANLSACGVVAPLTVRCQLDGTNGPAANTQYMVYYRSDGGGSDPDGLFMAYTSKSIGMVDQSNAAVTQVIPIRIQDGGGGIPAGTYYIMVSDTA